MGLLDSGAWQGKIYSDGWRPGSGGEHPVIEPATGDELGRIGFATPADVRRAASRAKEAQRGWAAEPYSKRAAVLRKAGDLWQAHAEEIKTWVVRETGAIGPMGELQVHVSAEECFEAAAMVSQPYGELLRSEQPRLSLARRVPAGVVGVIAPFNVPTILSIRAVAPALALGNAVVLKPDPRTSVVGGALLAQIFAAAGLPDGLLHVLPGAPGTGEAIVTDPGIRVIAFTGSTRAGRAVARLAGEHLKRVHLELGGNSAIIVLPDVDIEKATSVGAFGSFMHQGQICMSASRHLVHSSIAKDYAMALAARAEHLPVGDPNKEQVALGPVIDEKQRDNIHRIVTGSVQAGAALLAGGSFDGLFYRPTVLGEVPVSAPAYAEEIFGPVAPVTPFDSADEAAELAGGTEYGLSLSILTRDVYKGLQLAERIPSGLVHINDQTVQDEATIPFGGVGASGNGGRLGGASANLEAFTETQWVTIRGDLPAYPF
ncbi:MAG TPA: benzaldehyde dehydrogenase [Streptosporangiaceae bacterium]|jgi:benzaldehyde dehydrogenase (NAD)